MPGQKRSACSMEPAMLATWTPDTNRAVHLPVVEAKKRRLGLGRPEGTPGRSRNLRLRGNNERPDQASA
jgi:hypothetical protein